jgi:hypothetical protein
MPSVTPGPDDKDTARVTLNLELAPGESVSFTIEALAAPEAGEITGDPRQPHSRVLISPLELSPLPAVPALAVVGGAVRRLPRQGERLPVVWRGLRRLLRRLRQAAAANTRLLTLDGVLFGLVLITYLSTRFIGLVNFPIYFFTDEAVQTVLAADFVRDEFHNYDQDFLPTYFVNGSQYNLGTSVYLQIIPYVLFGKSEEATRGTAVLATLVGVIAVGLILRNVFKSRYWWLASLLLSATPAWFLHSRTAFETSLMVSMYAGFLYFYLMYRYRSPKYLYAALVLGGLTFYSYSPGQMVMLASGVLLLISDFRYHWQNRKTALVGLGVLVLVALPYVRFMATRGAENIHHLQILGSYITSPIPVAEKARLFFTEYLAGLNPLYWFVPNNSDLTRHLMLNYGHLPRFALPFMLLGIVICIRQWRSSAHRAVLAAMLAAPMGAALVQIGITRLLVFVIPAALLSALGVLACLQWLEKRRLPRRALALGVFLLLAGFNFYMLQDALTKGPLWFSDYGLEGMQYGASQLFSAVQDYQKQSPETQIIVSPAWSNGTDVVARFFLPVDTTVTLGSIEGYYNVHKPLTDNMLFVVIPEEYRRMQQTGKFTDIRIEKTLLYPNGAPGFYFLRLRYIDNIDEVLAAEKAARQKLLSADVAIAGSPATVRYSLLDMGPIGNLFDGNENSLIRSMEANPLILELEFPQPRAMSGVSVRIGGTATRITAYLTEEGQDKPAAFQDDFPTSPFTRDVVLDFGAAHQVKMLRLEITSLYDGEPAHVHVWEVRLR